MNVMGQAFSIKRNYNEEGLVISNVMDMGGREITMPFTDYKFDDKGNWISRKTSMMGQEMETPRKIEYYE